MKRTLIITTLLSASLLQSACDTGDTSAFGDGTTNGTTSASGVVSRTNFTLLFSEWALDVFDANSGAFAQTSTDINIHAGDVNGIAVKDQTIQVRVQWGVLSANYCITDEFGDCSVTWTTSESALAPTDTNCVRVVTYTTGAEAYYEDNINDTDGLDDIDAATLEGNTSPFSAGFWDMTEPYLDHNHNGSYDAGTDINIDINGNDTNDAGDGEFNGPNCNSTIATCSSTTTTTIWNESYIDLLDEGKRLPVTTPPAPNVCT